tara:strand:- start:193 stop:420 length:228 start_codon:yes stop_codon:yes gene_type:complete
MVDIGKEMYTTLIQKYKSEIQEHKTSLLIYFNNSVGIGDHPSHLEDMDELVSKMSCANDKLKMLTKMFNKTYSKL